MASSADLALGILGGDLKRRELLSARLGDVHSQLFMACSILKYYENQPASTAEKVHARASLHQALYTAQEALFDFYDNFTVPGIAGVFKRLAFPYGRILKKPDDDQLRALGDLIMEDNPVRQTFGKFIHNSLEPTDAFGRVESTYQKLLTVEDAWGKYNKAESRGKLAGDNIDARLASAVAQNIITQQEADNIREYDKQRYDALLTDAFEKSFFEKAEVEVKDLAADANVS